ncbi:NADPH:adrenodoxin oxidoreductase, mitochondrial-like isoform X1 [Ptychodera flava]|uniref:NADPH:adrenodoxin oxidoreductase, mitochondrial-like isoform X1 n=1 Tax=Ptychodera flava TaxID=63121 RepID=UPI003969FED6
MASTACARCRNLLTRRLFKSEMLMMPTAVHTKLPMISRLLSTVTAIPHVCIVGSGPAGFYTAQQILKSHKQARVDMVEKLPVPFGLVRFGVAPDHPEVKNCINQFTTTAENERFSFIGNVTIGTDISIADLKEAYDAVVLSYGAEDDRVLGIGGESLHGVYSARSFVGWYNGLPEDRRLNPDLSSDTAVVIGHGNVALDVARILLTPVDILQKTDITQHAIEALKESRVKTVYVVGRRGPLQVAFTIKELREMTKLPGCKSVFDTKDFEGLSELVPTLPRPRKRLTELMIKTADGQTASQQTQGQESPNKEWRLKFLRSPIEIVPSEDGKRVAGIRLEVNELKESEGRVQALPTGEEEILQCGLILRSIGYKSLPIDDSVPFDAKNGVIPNTAGRVSHLKGFYCSGWVRRGPTGVILSTMTDGFETGKSVVQDIESGELDIKSTVDKGRDKLLDIIEKKGLVPVTFDDWKRIDDLEKTRGESIGKPREKFLTVAEMLEAAFD